MSLVLKAHSNVADAATGRIRGRVKRVLEPAHKDRVQVVNGVGAFEPASEGKFFVEWEDGHRGEVSGEYLVARYSSHSQGWKPL